MTNLEQLGTLLFQVMRTTWNWSVPSERTTWNWSAPSCARNLELECSKLCAFFSNNFLVDLLIYSFINFLCLPLSLKYQNKYIKQWNVVLPNSIDFCFLTDVITTNQRFLLAVGLIDFTTATQVLFSPVLDEL